MDVPKIPRIWGILNFRSIEVIDFLKRDLLVIVKISIPN